MKNYEKLDNAIEELEKQSSDLKGFTMVYGEIIAKIKSDILNNLIETKENNKGISETVKKVEHHLEATKVKIDEIYENNKIFQKELDSSLFSRLEKHKSDIQIEIRDAGTHMQRSLETTLNSKLIEMDSNIKTQFEEAKTFVHDHFVEIESRLESDSMQHAKLSKTIIILSSILIAISLAITVAVYIIK